jgi:hypothetical protein
MNRQFGGVFDQPAGQVGGVTRRQSIISRPAQRAASL